MRENKFEEIIQYAKIYNDPPERERVGCRAIIIKDNKVLLSWEERKDVYMSPGGGVEESESLEECVVRELREEAGCEVNPLEHFLVINEYCFETCYVSNYFICEKTGDCSQSLTDIEIEHGITPVWMELEKAIELFSDYPNKREDISSLYLREFTVLNKLKSYLI
jgi:ADP-ribose pyrophosphatase YjhB (NUDIX family)